MKWEERDKEDEKRKGKYPLNATPLEAYGCLLPLAVIAFLIVMSWLI